ncbi:GAP1-N1 domain-containing protein [Sphingobium yanoikuyae]
MIIEQQLHGYQHGHELLSGTIRLPARDQDLIDRLSDVAGPLAPGEKFAPYLTGYPLPSGSHYVLARTWHDREAPRAGCVRTRSLIIPMTQWMSEVDPATLAAVANEVGPTVPCKRLSVDASAVRPLPPVDGPGMELLEAIFLEDSPSVAVFGAPLADTIALRIVTAIWPSMRRRFTFSTFCNSPRTIAKTSFNLVFAPVDARPNFSDWKGRRIDGSRSAPPRHPWASRIVDAVFRTPRPSLSQLDVFGEMAGDEKGTSESLRLSMLWEELSRKVETEPHAALGLLDIANTRTSRRADLVANLSTSLTTAARTAVSNFPPAEAWRFLQLLIEKLGSTKWRLSLVRAIRSLTSSFAARQPAEAISAIPSLLAGNGGDFLISGIAQGLAEAKPFLPVAQKLVDLSGQDLLKILMATPELLPMSLTEDAGIERPLAASLAQADPEVRTAAQRRMLPHLTSSRHAPLLRDSLSTSSPDEIVAVLEHLVETTHLEQAMLNAVIVERAVKAGASRAVRDVILRSPRSDPGDTMLISLLQPIPADVDWILECLDDRDQRRSAFLLEVLSRVPQGGLPAILSRPGITEKVITALKDLQGATDLLAGIAETVPMSANERLHLVERILPNIAGRRGSALAASCLDDALRQPPAASADKLLTILLDRSGGELDCSRVIRNGLASTLPSSVANRNLLLFDAAAPVTRKRLMAEPEQLTGAIMSRRQLDLSYPAAEAAARLLWDSAAVNNRGYVRSAARFLPYVMGQKGPSASALVTAAFPPVYRELQKESLPDFLSFVFMFLDWDRCKIARRELGQAALHSRWRPRDVALAAARAGDADRILRHISKREGGRAFITSVSNDITSIPEPSKKQVWRAIKSVTAEDGQKNRLPFDL